MIFWRNSCLDKGSSLGIEPNIGDKIDLSRNLWYPAPRIRCGKAMRNLFRVKLGERGPLTIIYHSGQGCLPRNIDVWTFLPGLTYLVLTPPFQVPDEPNHFLRSFQVSQGIHTRIETT